MKHLFPFLMLINLTMSAASLEGLLAKTIIVAPEKTTVHSTDPAEYFAGGSGDAGDPYQVATAEQLNHVRRFPAAHFIQVADIDLDVAPWNQGKGWQPVGQANDSIFTGTYDGGGYSISKLFINDPSSTYNGLFGRTSWATIQRVNLVAADVSGGDYTGILAGQVMGGLITEVVVSGEVTSAGSYVGGVVGASEEGQLLDSRSEASVSGHRYVGGLAGTGHARNCHATGSVDGLMYETDEGMATGGLLGQGFAVNSSASGPVTGGHEVGGLIGRGMAQNCQSSGAVMARGDYVGGLIGMVWSDEEEDRQEYQPGETAPATTEKETKTATSNPYQDTMVKLDDSTRVLIPARETTMEIVFEKASLDLPVDELLPPHTGFRSTGSMRVLTISGSGDPPALKPILTFPASEAGFVNPETIQVVRVSDLDVGGELREQHGVILPVLDVDETGYKFVDPLFPENITVLDDEKSAGSQSDETMQWVGETKYFLMTIDNSLNWRKRPVLTHMLPDSELSDDGYRQPSIFAEKQELLKQPVCNVVILVHGHNEEEKDGFLDRKISKPWEVRYKRLVWELLHKELTSLDDEDIPLYPIDCTLIYEYIYPTYRPIFSPVPERSGFTHATLGQDLGHLVNREFLMSNPQLKAMIEHDMPFNLFVVAHSQGGLVARAGLRFIDERILKHLKQYISWGSPHTGAGLYSLRYALAVGHDIVIDGYKLPMQNIGQSQAYQSAISALVLDAPGVRDMRFDASRKDKLRLGELMQENTATLTEFQDTELPGGSMFYSDNLRLFNEDEGSFIGDLIRDKYLLYTGTTSKEASLSLVFSWNRLKYLYNFGDFTTEIEKGAKMNKLVMKPAYAASDGAVPLYSQSATGIWPGGNIARFHFDDMDHEEFYGAEPPNRNEQSMAKGTNVAKTTLNDLGLDPDSPLAESRSCPELDIQLQEEQDSLVVSGKLIHALYDEVNDGDGKPGKRVERFEARRNNPEGEPVDALQIKHAEDGTFEGKIHLSDFPNDSVFVVATLLDQSLVAGHIDRKIENMVLNRNQNKWYAKIKPAVDEAFDGDTILVYPGTYEKEKINIMMKDLVITGVGGADATIMDGQGEYSAFSATNSRVVIEGFTIKDYTYFGIMLQQVYSVDHAIQPVVANNILINCEEGIKFKGKVAPEIRNNILQDCKYGIRDDYHGAVVDRPVLIEGNTINGTGSQEAIQLNGEMEFTISGNTLHDSYYGIILNEEPRGLISGNQIANHEGDGILMYRVNHSITIENNVIVDNYTGIDVQASGNGEQTISGNTITNNQRGITVQMGHSEAARVTLTNNEVSWNGDFVNNAYGLYIYSWSGNAGGHVTVSQNTISDNKGQSGAGMHIAANCLVEVSGNTISNNSASYDGGGLYVSSSGDVSIINNTIEDNQAEQNGGGIYSNPSSSITRPVISDNTIKSNFAGKHGGGIYGLGRGWPAKADVVVEGETQQVARHVPCFTEEDNTYEGNQHGASFGSWGPGTNNWCDDAGFEVYSTGQ